MCAQQSWPTKAFFLFPMLRLSFLLLSLPYTTSINDDASIYAQNQWISLSSQEITTLSPPPPVSTNYQLPTTEILIIINNFIDTDRCAQSLQNYIQYAKYPKRLKFGIIQEVNTEESVIIDNCLKKYCEVRRQQYPCDYIDQMKSIIYSKRLSRGPSHAHAFNEMIYDNEDYCLQTDSHIGVIQDWDVEMMTMWGQINNEYAILSTALPSIDVLGKKMNNRWEVPHLCHYSWDENGLPSSQLPAVAINLDAPLLASSWSDSFSFSKCHALKKTPNDPNIVRLESSVTDVLKFARLWTRGYDVYSPPRSVIAHDMRPNPSDWKTYGMSSLMKTRELLSAVRRVKTVLGIPIPGSSPESSAQEILAIGRYGLGTKRTLAQLSEFTGVDFRNGQLVDDRCRRLQWVPFKPDADPQCDESDLWGYAPESQTAILPLLTAPLSPESPLSASSSASSSSVPMTSLPWPLNFMDRIVELALKELSVETSRDEALQMLKIILLIVPIGAGLLALATWSIVSAGDDMRPPRKDSLLFGNDVKNV